MSEQKAGRPLSERSTLAQQWERFAKIIPAGAPAVQRSEMRRAWYAGAAMTFALLTNGVDEGTEPTDLDVQWMESISNELTAFGVGLAQGRE